MSTTSKTRYRLYNMHSGNRSPWFTSKSEAWAWVSTQGDAWTKHRVQLEEGSAIRRTKASDKRKGNHTHPPGRDKCRVCGV